MVPVPSSRNSGTTSCTSILRVRGGQEGRGGQGGQGGTNHFTIGQEQRSFASGPPSKESEEKEDTSPGYQCDHHQWNTSESFFSTGIGLQEIVVNLGLNKDKDQPQGRPSTKHRDQLARNLEWSFLWPLQTSENIVNEYYENPDSKLLNDSKRRLTKPPQIRKDLRIGQPPYHELCA